MQPVIGTNEKVGKTRGSWHIKFPRIMKGLFEKHRKKKIVVLLLIAVVITVLVLSLQDKGIEVSAGMAVKDTIEQTVFGTGKLEVKDKQEFYSESSTVVMEVLAEAGQKVSLGQVILRTDDDNLQIEASKNKLAYADIQTKLLSSQTNVKLYEQDLNLTQKKYEATKALFEAGAVSRSELDEAEKAYTQASAKLTLESDANLPLLQSQLAQSRLVWEKSEEKLQKAVVTSPVDGVLLNLPVQKGQRVEPGTLLASIGDPASLKITTGINEIDAAELKVGDKVEISNSSLLDEPLSGQVAYIAPIAEVVKTSQGDQNQVQIRITVNSDKGGELLKPGYNINFKIVLKAKEGAVLVPYEAVVKNDKQDVVYVIGQDGTVVEREVKTGLSNELFMEIAAGLAAGENVILSPGEQIKNGVKVKANAASQ